jgi:hypothetical protein
MLDDIFGVASWPTALVLAVLASIWAFNVHADRENAQEIRVQIVSACADAATDPDQSAERCAIDLRKALEAEADG